MATVDPNAKFIPLEGLSLAIVVVSLVFLFFSALTVGGRTYVRLINGVFGLDDNLMVFGTFVYAAAVALSCYAASVGLGSRDDKHNEFFSEEGKKYFTIWILVYVHALATVKSSVCVTLLRIAGTRQAMQRAVWVLLVITWASYLVTFIGDMLVCRPLEASWKPSLVLSSEAYCAPMEVMIGLSHTATGSTVATDLACAVLPGIILWNTQMDKKSKWSAYALLSFASIDDSQRTSRKPWDRFSPKSLITFGSLPNHDRGSGSRTKFRNPTDVGFSLTTVHAQGNWEQLKDGDPDKDPSAESGVHGSGIRADYTYAVERSQSPGHGKSFYISGDEAVSPL
ncbi:uncharacterized protein F4822DRAFT_431740 [Hypoxylon trugodes]|uniref:uncharacterized protein n=1 Tax=Hypoxylon trugodes TaxID=326681 RepID=UPI00218D7D56|nr:uncharacterized protein F4822DRAFT_431740 [Hypoxylon trugodes]KAI1386874.1 hypothetical protein F4822DRAFT_431740 [Hypoxylon trugodes]